MKDWAEMRLASAERRAESAGGEAWEFLRDLAAAYGRIELARKADGMAAREAKVVASPAEPVGGASKRASARREKKASVRSHEVGAFRFSVKATAQLPQSRAAWIERILDRSGVRWRRDGASYVVEDFAGETRAMLAAHAELAAGSDRSGGEN